MPDPHQILLVEDEPAARDELRDVLEHAGFSVVEAPDGRRALHYLTSEAPEPGAIILDLRMPEMSGWELINILKSYSRLSHIPVIVMSGFDPIRHALPMGGYHQILRKPIAPELLVATVKECLAA